MKRLLLVGLFLISSWAFAEASSIGEYFKQTCRVEGTGQEMVRRDFLTLVYNTARHQRHCIVGFLKNGGYTYTASGDYLDDYTPRSRYPKNCKAWSCL